MPSRSHTVAPGEIERRCRRLCAEAVNRANEELFRLSQLEVPIGPGPNSGALLESGHISKEADPHSLIAETRYGTPYGAAQHEGEADMIRGYTVVHWVVRKYSMPGRKKKFLEDPLKVVGPRLEKTVAHIVRVGLG